MDSCYAAGYWSDRPFFPRKKKKGWSDQARGLTGPVVRPWSGLPYPGRKRREANQAGACFGMPRSSNSSSSSSSSRSSSSIVVIVVILEDVVLVVMIIVVIIVVDAGQAKTVVPPAAPARQELLFQRRGGAICQTRQSIYIYIYTHIHMYIYIYIYVYTRLYLDALNHVIHIEVAPPPHPIRSRARARRSVPRAEKGRVQPELPGPATYWKPHRGRYPPILNLSGGRRSPLRTPPWEQIISYLRTPKIPQ